MKEKRKISKYSNLRSSNPIMFIYWVQAAYLGSMRKSKSWHVEADLMLWLEGSEKTKQSKHSLSNFCTLYCNMEKICSRVRLRKRENIMKSLKYSRRHRRVEGVCGDARKNCEKSNMCAKLSIRSVHSVFITELSVHCQKHNFWHMTWRHKITSQRLYKYSLFPSWHNSNFAQSSCQKTP